MQEFDRHRQSLAVGLAGLAGYVDAVGFLSADRYFVSFMSGNTTRMAVDLLQDRHRAIIFAFVIGAFVMGVAIGNVVATLAGTRRKPAVLGLVTLFLAPAPFLRNADLTVAMLVMLALAMGALNNALRREEDPVGLTYMTGALVRIGQVIGAALCGKRRGGWAIYLLLWLSLATGAVLGAAAFLHAETSSLWLAICLCGLLALVAFRLPAAPRS